MPATYALVEPRESNWPWAIIDIFANKSLCCELGVPRSGLGTRAAVPRDQRSDSGVHRDLMIISVSLCGCCGRLVRQDGRVDLQDKLKELDQVDGFYIVLRILRILIFMPFSADS